MTDGNGQKIAIDSQSITESSKDSDSTAGLKFISQSGHWCTGSNFQSGTHSTGESVTITLTSEINLPHSYQMRWVDSSTKPVDWRLEGRIKGVWHTLDGRTAYTWSQSSTSSEHFSINRNLLFTVYSKVLPHHRLLVF